MSTPEQRDGKQGEARAADLRLIQSARRVVQAVEPFDIQNPEHRPGPRAALRAAVTEELRAVWADLLRLHAEFVPDATLPNPPGCACSAGTPRPPIENFLMCHEMCAACRAEAIRAMDFIADRLEGRREGEKFISDSVAAERLAVGRVQSERETRRRDAIAATKSRLITREIVDQRGKIGVEFRLDASGTRYSAESGPVPSTRHAEFKAVSDGLSVGELDVLQYLAEKNAVDRSSRRSAAEIADGVFGDADPIRVKNTNAGLVKRALVRSKTGRNGGSWITDAGLACLRARRPGSQKR